MLNFWRGETFSGGGNPRAAPPLYETVIVDTLKNKACVHFFIIRHSMKDTTSWTFYWAMNFFSFGFVS